MTITKKGPLTDTDDELVVTGGEKKQGGETQGRGLKDSKLLVIKQAAKIWASPVAQW